MKLRDKKKAPKKFEAFRKLLLDKRAEVLSSLGDTRFDTIASMGRVAEEDQAQISHEEYISLNRNKMDYDMLRKVDAALDRIRTGEYGVCTECEEEISEKRLKAVPWAEYCVHCQDRASGITLIPGAGRGDSVTATSW
jgi:DnaK suppressor protein